MANQGGEETLYPFIVGYDDAKRKIREEPKISEEQLYPFIPGYDDARLSERNNFPGFIGLDDPKYSIISNLEYMLDSNEGVFPRIINFFSNSFNVDNVVADVRNEVHLDFILPLSDQMKIAFRKACSSHKLDKSKIQHIYIPLTTIAQNHATLLYIHIEEKPSYRVHIKYYDSDFEGAFLINGSDLEKTNIYYKQYFTKAERFVKKAISKLHINFTHELNPLSGDIFPIQNRNDCAIHAMMYQKFLHEKKKFSYEDFSNPKVCQYRLNIFNTVMKINNLEMSDFKSLFFKEKYEKLQSEAAEKEHLYVWNDKGIFRDDTLKELMKDENAFIEHDIRYRKRLHEVIGAPFDEKLEEENLREDFEERRKAKEDFETRREKRKNAKKS